MTQSKTLNYFDLLNFYLNSYNQGKETTIIIILIVASIKYY